MKTARKSGRDCIRFHLLTPANTAMPVLTAAREHSHRPVEPINALCLSDFGSSCWEQEGCLGLLELLSAQTLHTE